MRIVAIGLLTAVAALSVSVEPSSAQNRRWCTEKPIGSFGFPNCAYDTYQQCYETSRGLGLSCTQNSSYTPERKAAPRKSRRSKTRRSDG